MGKVRNHIADLTKQIETAADNVTQVKLRIERTRVYIRYLAMIEEKWVVECKRRGLEESWGKQVIGTEVMQAVEGDMRKVLASAERMAKR
jgi:hypothetical protein